MAHTKISLVIDEVLDAADREDIEQRLQVVGDDYTMRVETDVLKPSFTVKVRRDEWLLNPREEWDNVGVMFCRHNRYTLGDKGAEDPYEEVPENELAEGTPNDGETYRVRGDIALILPIYIYDHSGLTVSHAPFSCQWDSGQIGWHYITDAAAAENWPDTCDKETLLKCLSAELKVYDQYLQGDVWGFVIEDEDEDEDGDVIDSCYGFYGDTLEETGILDHVDAKYHDALKLAWEDRE